MKNRISTCATSAFAVLVQSGKSARRWATAVSALLVLVLARHAAGQIGTGTLIGQVVDASTKSPRADVVVTATSSALQGEQTVVTDSAGTFRIPNLPPGEYTLRYEADTFKPYSRGGILLRGGITLRVDAELLPDTLKAEEVTVVAKPPTVDVGSSRSGVTLNSEFTSRLPVAPPTGKGGAARSFEQLADIAPGAHNDLYGASISGTTSVENQYIIDGLSVGDPGFGYNGTPLSIDFLKEVNIVTGGYLPEYGRGGGGILDVVTKSGSNEFHGSFFGNYTPWQAAPTGIQAQNSIRTTPRLQSQGDIGFDLGGPIVRDKLWFYFGADLSHTSYSLTRDLNVLSTDPTTGEYLYDSNGLIQSNPIPGTTRVSRAVQTAGQYIAKLTYTPSSNDRLELAHHGTPSTSGGSGNYSIDYETGTPSIGGTPTALGANQIGTYNALGLKSIFTSYDTSLKWIHTTPDKKLTFDTTVGWHHQRAADLPADGSEVGGPGLASLPSFRARGPGQSITRFENLSDPSVCTNPVADGANKCPVPQYDIGGPGFIRDRTYDRYQLREVATFLAQGLGHHIMKAGLELEYLGFDSHKAYSGGPWYRQSTGGGSVTDLRGFGGQTAPDDAYRLNDLHYKTQSLSFGAFAQDSWSVADKITLNVGLRYDTQVILADGGGLALSLPNQWSPRVGVIFDPLQNGRSKIFANYAIYYQSIPLDIADRAGSGEPQVATSRSYANCTPGSAGYPASCENPANLTNYNNAIFGAATPSQKWFYLTTGKTAIDPNLKPESSSEFSAGAEYEIIPGGRIGLTYIRRWMNNVIEDMSRDNGSTFFLGNPGSGIATDFPKAQRNYDAGTVSFTKTLGENWLAQASYTVSYLRGNWEGLFRSQTGQLDPGINSDFDLQQLTVNRTGPLAGDHTHEIKLFVARDLPFDPQNHVTVGASYRGRSGAPTTPLGADPTYGTDELFLLPRGSGPRLPWVHTIDLHAGYTFFQTHNQTFSVTADVFNLFNFQAVTLTTQRYTLRSVQPITNPTQQANPYVNGNPKVINPALLSPTDGEGPFTTATDKNNAYGAPAAYQDPITIRLGVRTTF